MKRLLFIFSSVLLLASCVGKMKDLKLSEDEVVFPSEASSCVVTADVEMSIDLVNEDNASLDIYSDNMEKYEGNWITVTNYGTAILIEAAENTSAAPRSATIALRAYKDANMAGKIEVIQQGLR